MTIFTVQKPGDCILLVGLPTTLSHFEQWESGRMENDFLSESQQSQTEFFKQVSQPLSNGMKRIQRKGCKVVTPITTSVIAEAFRADVVIFFSHCRDDKVETGEGMMAAELISKQIPKGFKGFIDLSACNSIGVALHLRNHFPECTVKCILTHATPAFWIEIIDFTLAVLAKGDMTYSEALDVTLEHFARSLKRTIKG